MFCAKCGQQQVSEDVRFCCACGTKLGSAEGSTRRIIAMVMHIALTALAIAGWGPWSGPMYTQIRVLIVLVSVVTFLLLFSSDLKAAFSKLFGQGKDKSDEETAPSSSALSTFSQVAGPRQSALPPTSSVPVDRLGRRDKNTAEMVRPPSITEHTTELLDKD
jgi:hypothetical protein